LCDTFCVTPAAVSERDITGHRNLLGIHLRGTAMRTLKVRLYIRVRLRDGHYAYLDPVWNKNHTLRAGYALVKGKAESHGEGDLLPALSARRQGRQGVQQSQQSGLVRRRVFDELVRWQSGCMSLRSNIFLDLFPSSVTFAKFIPCISDPAPNGCPPPVAGGLRSGPRCGTNSDPTGAERVVFRGSSC